MKISKELISQKAVEICQILSNKGYQAFLVGGCIRDLLLGHTPKDYDITTDASPEEVINLFPKTIPTGLQHGTVTVVMGIGVENHFEVTTFRVEGEYLDGRRPGQVFFVANVEKDLARRDLTINAIAYDPVANWLVDPYEGIKDLKAGIIRAVGNPEARFQEDGLRIMRAARFAARFGYELQPATFEGMKNNLQTLKMVSKERVADELCKTLMTPNPQIGFKILHESGALAIACPMLSASEIALLALSELGNCKGELETRLAFLYSNCSPKIAETEMLALKFSNKEIRKVVFLLQLQERYLAFASKESEYAYKDFMAMLKNQSPSAWEPTLEQFLQLTEAMGISSRAVFRRYERVTVLSRKELQLNGNDLLAAGVKPGPQIKEILEKCYLEVLRDPGRNDRDFLLSSIVFSGNV